MISAKNPNPRRGEISATIGGSRKILVLTLGSLAQLEEALGEDMMSLAERFAEGRIRASDITHILCAGLRGAGHEADEKEIAATPFDGGAAEALAIASRLLAAAFVGEEETAPSGKPEAQLGSDRDSGGV